MALTRSRTKPTTEEKPSRRKADENPEEDSRAGGRKERLRLRRKYWGAEGLGYGIDRSIVFGRHCPQYGDKTRRKKLPCYRTKARTDKKWNGGGDGREMKTEGNRRQMAERENLPSARDCRPSTGRLTFEVSNGGNQKYELCSTNKPVEMRINCAKSVPFLSLSVVCSSPRWSHPKYACTHTGFSWSGGQSH